jgi:hypothetical protein
MGEVLRTVVTRPLFTIQATLTWAKAEYVLLLLLPLAGISLLAWRELVFMLPILGLNLLATKPQLSDVRYWYSMLLVGPLIVAAIVALRWLQQRWPRAQRNPWWLIAPIFACTLVANVITPNPVVSLLRNHEPPERVAVANRIVATIPPDARVAASGRLAPHLLRRYLYYFPLAEPSVLPQIDVVAVDVAGFSRNDPSSLAQLEALQQSDEWVVVIDEEGFQLFTRRGLSTR